MLGSRPLWETGRERQRREAEEAEEERIARERAKERIDAYDAWQAKLEWEEEQKDRPKKPSVGPYANSEPYLGPNNNSENDVYK